MWWPHALLVIIFFLIFVFLAVDVEMKGKNGYLSASDWPLYPVSGIFVSY